MRAITPDCRFAAGINLNSSALIYQLESNRLPGFFSVQPSPPSLFFFYRCPFILFFHSTVFRKLYVLLTPRINRSLCKYLLHFFDENENNVILKRAQVREICKKSSYTEKKDIFSLTKAIFFFHFHVIIDDDSC